ncbi:aromatic ring-hydroxylating oxygenase subunit alpha [Sinimarinibacterium flocculans]|uniref:aromatic ring-hydroxylating oxygenase subunit alpha n=1 Tax=Sinimarinibacterium flocculans TaxID=985250 RepID=UPI002491BB7E|nr:aromatic ring-hydroxylating dioxygenase subunit alpha [Sinimarinibacterium flocculans]
MSDFLASAGVDAGLFTRKPGERWIDKYPHLNTEPVSYESATSPEFYALEREAVFRRSWLYVGRTEWVSSPGQFFTKEIEVCNTSVIVVRGKDQEVRAFHNVCPHRGNKLVWDTHPASEVQGRCARFYCKYHGIGFGLDGRCEHLTDAESWYGEQGSGLKLAEVPCELWNGFIFINLTPEGPQQSLRQFLGEYYWKGFDGYPFEKLTSRFSSRGVCRSNWKTLMDAFNEVYHGVFVHQQSFPYLMQFSNEQLQAMRNNFFALIGRHGFYNSPRNPQGLFVTDLERLAVAAGTGPQHPFEIPLDKMVPPAANPLGTEDWGTSSHFIFPNLQIQFYYPGWYLTYQYWPLAHNRMRFEVDMHFLPARNFSEMFSHYGATSIFLDALLQDVNNLEATQRGLESGVFNRWPLSDEEIMVRGFHQQIYDAVEQYCRAAKS